MPLTKPTAHDYAVKAQSLWRDVFTEKERTIVRFGMLPHDHMMAAEALGYDGRTLSVELMKVADQNGGMIA